MRYSLARLGLFLVAAVIMFAVPFQLNPYLKLGLALIASAIGSFVLLRKLRDQVAEQLATASRRRVDRKERLRDALAGDQQDDE